MCIPKDEGKCPNLKAVLIEPVSGLITMSGINDMEIYRGIWIKKLGSPPNGTNSKQVAVF